ncbi:MRC1-like domain-containing protein [Triangularia verruculosa]|uniref:MRC1-like domain-containing protein n=1 Tax=Triangularia verruculosa TaxID=2587418 RepID=A0AAN7AWW6_9PEZI|nr:MRC1-like domain-containing protein [Triangularia verruculosa]
MPSSPAPSRRSGSATPIESPTATRIRSNNRFLNFGDDSGSSEGEGDEEILRPRGKLAARMLGGNIEPTDDSGSEKGSPKPSSPRKPAEAQEAENGEDDEDEIIAPRPRKLLKARRLRSTTPDQEPTVIAPRSHSPEKSNSPARQELFVSPSKPGGDTDSDDDDVPSPSRLVKNAKFEALVAKKRAERLAREAEEARKKAERNASDMMVDDEDPEDFTDDEGGQKLTQDGAKSRPSARKASKKALEEMNRETQRMTRALQLAHEAKVKKKISKSTLFERFNFKPAGAASTEAPKEKAVPVSSSRAGTPASIQQSDAEPKEDDTPPSSPPEGEKEKAAPVPQTMIEDDSDDELPTVEEMAAAAAAAPKKHDKGKGKATAADFEAEDKAKEQQQLPRVMRNLRVKFPQFTAQANAATLVLDDDDDDLEIQKPSKIDEILSRVNPNQSKEPKALLNLRRLAQLDDPDKKAGPVPTKQKFQQHQKPAMTVGELQMNLMQRAKAQAKLERERHLESLRAKGIVVMTAEEREKEEQEVEDIVAKARREAEEIMAREREDAKEERRKKRAENGEDPLDWDDSDYDGESWVGEGEEDREIELSGSEEEDEDEDEEMEEGGALIDGAAEESGDEDAEEVKVPNSDDEDDLPTGTSMQARRKARKQAAVLSDDDEEADEGVVKATPNPKKILAKSPSVRQHTSPSIPTSVLRSATKTFIPGLPVAGPAGLGLTQIFQGTMDDSQMGSAPADSPSQPRPTFDMGVFPDSQFSQSVQEPAGDVVMDSQPAAGGEEAETQGVQIQFSQSQVHGFDSFLRDDTFDATQASELIEPTQDPGFKNLSPLRRSFIEEPTSTVETLPVDQSSQVADSPLVRRTGKLRRRVEATVSENEDEDEAMEDSLDTDAASSANNAFAAMKEAARKEKERKRKEAFDKKKSKAREMVEEQAEESEDEYAGLGGADGEDSDDDDAKSVQEMIDDETADKAEDERKLAAFYADRERAADEKQVNKLFHDITTGLLRRKRAGNWDELDDEDDGGEALRRMKRRQFAKMQRALFADERISKVAENPRNQAFLKTIEDRGSDDEMDFIWAPPPAAPGLDSQNSATGGGDSSNEAVTIPDSQPQQQQQQSTNPRRTKPGLGDKKKPSNIGEIRESLSNLLEDGPHYNSSSVIPATMLDSDSENEGASHPPSSASSNKENDNKSKIVDRISLKRTSSSRLAYGNSSSDRGFKIPALLRRATTNSSSLSASSAGMSSTGVTTSNLVQVRAEDGGGIKIKQTASKKSGVSYLARGNERLASLAEKERRREEKKFKGAMAGERKKALGGMFGGGQFE